MSWVHAQRWRLPAAIALFFLLQAVLRLLILPGSLDIDEAQFVGQAPFQSNYADAHPPLFNWLISLAVAACGGRWDCAAAATRAVLLASTFILAWDCGNRIVDRSWGGGLSVAFLALVPEISFQSQHTLAHSLLLTTAVVMTLNGTARWWQGQPSGYSLLVVGIVTGTLAKYNYLLFFGALALAAVSIRPIRRRLPDRNLARALLFAATVLSPFAWWAAHHLEDATGRIYKLYQPHDSLAAMDVPGLGVDGLVSLVARAGTWLLPVALVTVASARLADRCDATPQEEGAPVFLQWLWRTAVVGILVAALAVLVADVHRVHTRYLTPILLPLPFAAAGWVALRPRPWGRRLVLACGLTFALLMSVAVNVRYLISPISMALPFDALVTALRERFPQGVTVVDWHLELAGNVAARWEDARIGQWHGLATTPVIALAEERDHAEQLLARWSARGLQPAGPWHRIPVRWANQAAGSPFLVWRCLTTHGRSAPAACGG